MGTSAPQRSTASEIVRSILCEDGYTLQYRVWPSPHPAVANVLLLNGMMSHSGWFRDLARPLTDLNLNVVGADRRGSGLNKAARGDAPSRQLLISDLLRIARNEDHQLPTIVIGWCWGAILAINFALQPESGVKGLAMLAPGMFPSMQVKSFVKTELRGAMKSEWDSAILPSPLTPEMFSARPSIQSFIRRDPLAQSRFSRRFFEISNAMSLIATARLSQFRQPILTLLAERDVTADNAQMSKALSRVRTGLLTQATLNCNHGMQFEVPQQVVGHIASWLREYNILAAK